MNVKANFTVEKMKIQYKLFLLSSLTRAQSGDGSSLMLNDWVGESTMTHPVTTTTYYEYEEEPEEVEDIDQQMRSSARPNAV